MALGPRVPDHSSHVASPAQGKSSSVADANHVQHVRTQATSLYRSGGVEAVRTWIRKEAISHLVLREAFADDPAALQIIDRDLAGDAESPGDFEALLADHLAHLRGTWYYEHTRYTLTDHTHFYPLVDLIDTCAQLRGARVLDYGSGAGALLLALVERGATLAAGAEVDDKLHRLAEARYRGREAQIRCLLSPSGALPLPDGSFDIVISSHVIEHAVDQASYLAEVVRVLAPGGVAVFLCPNRWWPFEPHGRFLFLSYLPRPTATALCRRLRSGMEVGERLKLPGCTKNLHHRLNASTMVSHFVSPRSLTRLVSRAGLIPRVCNPPARLPSLAPRLWRFLRLAPALHTCAAYLLSREIFLVADKPGRSDPPRHAD